MSRQVAITPEAAPLPQTVIRPSRGWVSLNLGEIWAYRELLYFLVWRDLKVRYKQTVLGAAWAILQPVLTMLVFTVVFGRLAKVPTGGVPYPIFVFTALLPWQLFAHALTESGNSLVVHQSLLTKVYFPRLVLPLAAVMAGFADFGIALLVLVGMMLHYGISPGAGCLALPLFVALAAATALAAGTWLSALNVRYRDVRYTIPFLTQIWFFVTPVAYPSELVPERWRAWLGLNPMAGVVEGFRWALLGRPPGTDLLRTVSTFVVLLFLAGGVIYFRRSERRFADVV
jgi:homopolymeric O-antigen transport system permease protein